MRRPRTIDSASPFIADELAFIYLEHGGDVNVALSLAQMAKQRMPGSPVTADALGWAYYKLGAYGSAVAQLRECVQKVPNNPVYQYHLGMAYIAAGNRDSAQRALQKALKDNSNFLYSASAQGESQQTVEGHPLDAISTAPFPFAMERGRSLGLEELNGRSRCCYYLQL